MLPMCRQIPGNSVKGSRSGMREGRIGREIPREFPLTFFPGKGILSKVRIVREISYEL